MQFFFSFYVRKLVKEMQTVQLKIPIAIVLLKLTFIELYRNYFKRGLFYHYRDQLMVIYLFIDDSDQLTYQVSLKLTMFSFKRNVLGCSLTHSLEDHLNKNRRHISWTILWQRKSLMHVSIHMYRSLKFYINVMSYICQLCEKF